MAELVTLTEDGPLGAAGSQVWVDDPAQAAAPAGWGNKSKKSAAPAEPVAPVTTADAAPTAPPES